MAEDPFRGETKGLSALQHLPDHAGREEGMADRLLDAVLRNAILLRDLGIGLARFDPIKPAEGGRDVGDQLSVKWLASFPRISLVSTPRRRIVKDVVTFWLSGSTRSSATLSRSLIAAGGFRAEAGRQRPCATLTRVQAAKGWLRKPQIGRGSACRQSSAYGGETGASRPCRQTQNRSEHIPAHCPDPIHMAARTGGGSVFVSGNPGQDRALAAPAQDGRHDKGQKRKAQ